MEIISGDVQIRDIGAKFSFKMPLPETLDEAIARFGEDNVFKLYKASLKVKYQNKARDCFRAGKTEEEVNEIIENFIPGGDPNRGLKTRAMNMIVAKKTAIKKDPDLQMAAMVAYNEGQYARVLELLEDIPVEKES